MEENQTDNSQLPQEENESSGKTSVSEKKMAWWAKVLIGIGIFLGVIILSLGSFLLYCKLDTRSVLQVIPRNYSFYIHTDSAYDTVESVADVKAVDVLLASSQFKGFRQAFINYRSSPLRDNPYFKFLAGRTIDAAFYMKGNQIDYIAVVDLSWMSSVSRNAHYFADYLSQAAKSSGKLSYIANKACPYYEFTTLDGHTTIYFAAADSLIVIASNSELLQTSLLLNHESEYKESEKQLLNSSFSDGLRVVVNAGDLVQGLEQNAALSPFVSLVDKENLGVVDFTISDSDIDVKCSLPFVINEENPSELEKLLLKESTSPVILSRTADCIQYYTFINAGSLTELKDAALSVVQDRASLEENLNFADSMCQKMLDLTLEDLLFSWSGNEFAAFGVEHQNDPVFAIQVKDEKQRQKVFEKLTDSILIKEDNSLILGGVRLNRLSVPSYIGWILKKFDIDLPSPYFMVHENYIYFSESPECLSAIYTNSMAGKVLLHNPNWKAASGEISTASTVSLYYNLERSMPFFMRQNKELSNVLKLYTIGRFDIEVKDRLLGMNLHACARKSGDLSLVPGFPMKLKGKVIPENFVMEAGDNPSALFWVEDSSLIKVMNLKSLEIKELNLGEKINICASSESSADGGLVWTVSDFGTVNLFSRDLVSQDNFPVLLASRVAARPVAHRKGIYIPLESGIIVDVKSNGDVSYIKDTENHTINSAVSVCEDYGAVYEKGFLGNIYIMKNGRIQNKDEPLFVPEIGFENAALSKHGGNVYAGFVSQAGKMYMWKDGESVKDFPVELDGVFNGNCQATDKYFYALSTKAELFRIDEKGNVLSVRIPHATAEKPYLTVRKVDGKKCIFVCADANVIYGFNEKLELLSAFPLVGWGRPVFADIDGDKIIECLALTIDGQITAWKLR